MEMYESDLVDYYDRARADPTDPTLKSPSNPRELMIDQFFLPFMITYLKDLKCDTINMLKAPEMNDLIESFKVKQKKKRRAKPGEDAGPTEPVNPEVDLTKLKEEQHLAFRSAFCEEKLFDENLNKNTNRKALDLILNALFMVITNTIPEEVVSKLEKEIKQFKIERVYEKVQFTNIPEGVEIKDRTVVQTAYNEEFEKDLKKNTNEIALVRLRIPVNEQTHS